MTTTTADVVIVGAGILGAAAAYYLTLVGQRVIVLERGASNREGSGATAGNLHIQGVHTRRPGQAVPIDSARFLPLQRASSDRWADIETQLGTSIELQRAGGFTVAETDEQCRELETKAGWEATAGIPTEILDGDTARKRLPHLGTSVRAATWCALDGYANPLQTVVAFLTAARRQGATVHTQSPVTAIARRRQTWLVTTPKGGYEAPVVVDVAGPWLPDIAALAGIRLRLAPVAIQMHATVRQPPTLHYLVQHIGEGLSVKQVAAGNLLIGGGWPAAALDLNGRSRPSTASLAGNIRLAARILPFIAGLRLLRMWAGPLAATPDEMPVIGAVPGLPDFYVAGGTYAFTFAPLWGEVIASLVTGRRPELDLDDLSPSRLIETSTAPIVDLDPSLAP